MRILCPIKRSLLAVAILAFVLSACSSSAPAQAVPTLKIAVLPILDALPMYVAQQEGYFEKHGLKVEFIPVASAPERDQVIASGQADGMINEVVTTLFYNKTETRVQIVRFARAATSISPLFRILASKNSGITKPEQLKGVPVGISDASVIAYLTDRLLEKEGLSPDEIQTVSVPKIPDRMQLLNSGELKAAMLPDPTSTLSIQQGAVVIVDDTISPELSHSVYSFRKAVLDSNPTAVRAFLAAIEEAVQAINQSPDKWGKLLGDQKIVPAALIEGYKVPTFVTAGVPNEAQYNDVLSWAKAKGLLDRDIPYSECVTDQFLN
jgi:NitT/TauT family transport system substrate-binding protein